MHKVYRLPFTVIVEQTLEHAHIGKIYQRTFIPDNGDAIEFQSEWQMGATIHPEATYLLFPFNTPNAQARFDIGGMPVLPHLDQLAGSCRDYFTVQGWVDFNNGERGVTIATPENPMAQLGDFHFAHNQQDITLERAMFLGWVTNNYWETNFPGAQPGTVTARYAILPYVGDFDESRAYRFASETEHARPLVQHLGEPAATEHLPASGELLRLPQPPILTLNLRAESEAILLTLFNASDESQMATIEASILPIVRAERCGLFSEMEEPIPAQENSVFY
ncbi:MAG: hypothetical protein HY867_14140 [Chloroflexi bacterium]|nr:hypothetical protein [Chloroflexota bacterium]